MTDEEEPELVPKGAVDCVLAWCEAVVDGDFGRMWACEDDNLRLCEAQLWLHANRAEFEGVDLDAFAADLSLLEGPPERRPFEDGRVAVNVHYVPSWPRDRWAPLMNRRLVGEDLDGVILVDSGALRELPADSFPDPAITRPYLVRFTADGWRLAGFDYEPPVPGWPPRTGAP